MDRIQKARKQIQDQISHTQQLYRMVRGQDQQIVGISKRTHMQYAYHQGQAGFKTGAYKNKKRLLAVAEKTSLNTKKFDQQLKKCM